MFNSAMFFFHKASFLLGDAATNSLQGNNMTRTLMFFGIVLVFFYLILWRPEQKRRKKMQSTRESLKPGDRVTAIGIVGEVAEIKEQTAILKMVDGSKIEVLKQAITDVVSQSQESDVKQEPELKEVTSE